MKNTYIQFYDIKSNNEISQALGSDSIGYIDGRWNIDTIKNKAFEQANKLKRVGRDFVGFAIFKRDYDGRLGRKPLSRFISLANLPKDIIINMD